MGANATSEGEQRLVPATRNAARPVSRRSIRWIGLLVGISAAVGVTCGPLTGTVAPGMAVARAGKAPGTKITKHPRDAVVTSAQGARSRQLAVSMGVSVGLGGGKDLDVLHLGDPGWDNYVSGYLNQMHVSWVHMNVPWCALEPRAGVFNRLVYKAVKSRVDRAAASGKHAFVTVIEHAPVFARRAAMLRDRTGRRLDSSYTGCDKPRVYPGGEPAPKLTKGALRNYARTVGKFKNCLRGAYCSGPDNRSQVLIESGAETNWHGGWQTGVCARGSGYGGVAWYDSRGKDCGRPGVRRMDSGAISHIQVKDARFFGAMANRAARRLHGSLAFGDDVILGAPLFRGNGTGWGRGSVAGAVYLAQAVSSGGPRHWDVAALHVTVCDDGVTVSWNDCAGSMNDHLDEIRSTLRAASINVPIWITGAIPCSEGDTKRVNGQIVYRCTAHAQARDVQGIIHGLRSHACSGSSRPVTLINWFRIVDPDNGGQFSGIGFMRNRSSAPYVPPYIKKAPYRAMAAHSNLSCTGG